MHLTLPRSYGAIRFHPLSPCFQYRGIKPLLLHLPDALNIWYRDEFVVELWCEDRRKWTDFAIVSLSNLTFRRLTSTIVDVPHR